MEEADFALSCIRTCNASDLTGASVQHSTADSSTQTANGRGLVTTLGFARANLDADSESSRLGHLAVLTLALAIAV